MTAGNRPPSRALALAIAISIALHAGVLLNLGSTAQRAANATRPLTARLVPGIPEPAEAPRRATVPPVPLTRSAPKQKAAKALFLSFLQTFFPALLVGSFFHFGNSLVGLGNQENLVFLP